MYTIPSSRTVDWTYCGVPGGIPNYTTVHSTLSPGATRAQVNSAITSASSAYAGDGVGRVVYLNAGTYSLSGTVVPKTGVVLRGAGAGKTTVNVSKIANVDVGYSSYYSISSGYTKGSTSLTMAATPTDFEVGGVITVIQNDDTSFIMTTGSPGQNLNTLHRITGKAGNVLSIEPPLPYGLTAGLSPKAAYFTPQGITLAGLESMTLNATGTGDFIEFWSADRCWVKDCEVYNARNAFTFWVWCLQCEIRRCYFRHAYGAPNNSDGYPVYFHSVTSHCLAVDNIAYETWGSILMTGSSANAALYNYTWKTTAQGLDTQVDALNCNHGAHGLMSLWEGNFAEQFMNDAYHGTGSHQTLFRNWLNGLHPTKTANRIMANLNRGSYYHNVVGNVLGDSSWNPTAYKMVGNADESNGYIYRLGYPNMGSNSLTQETDFPLLSNTYPDARVESTLIRHANYDYYNDAQTWEDADHSIPNSLFYTSKPSWFGSLTWPPVNPVGPVVNDIPAKWRWDQYQATSDLDYLFTDDIGEATGWIHTFDAAIIVSENETARLYVEYPHVRVVAGTSATYTIWAEAYNSFTANITLDAAGLPTNATDSYGTNPMAYNGSSVATITTTDVAAGTYSIYFTGTAAGGEVGSVRVILEVVESDDCSVKVPIRKIRVKQGDSAVFTVEASPTAGYTGAMDLSDSGVPTGATAEFGEDQIDYNESTTYTVDSGTAAVGEHEITITGEGPV